MKLRLANEPACARPLQARIRHRARPGVPTAAKSRPGQFRCGPLLSLNLLFAGDGAATGQLGSARRSGEAVFAALRLPCAARVRGPAAQLAALTAFAALGQARRVGSRGALCARAPHPVLHGASHVRRALPSCPVAEPDGACAASNTARRFACADAGIRAQTCANRRDGTQAAFCTSAYCMRRGSRTARRTTEPATVSSLRSRPRGPGGAPPGLSGVRLAWGGSPPDRGEP
jgi:hypothetical protein